MDFDQFASAPKGDNGSTGWNDTTVIGFLTACRDAKVRVPYGGISLLKKPDGNFNRGRHGANVVKSLPLDLQPIVCRSNGTYHDKAGEAFKAIENFDAEDGPFTAEVEGEVVTGLSALVTWNVIQADKVQEAFEAYKAQQAE